VRPDLQYSVLSYERIIFIAKLKDADFCSANSSYNLYLVIFEKVYFKGIIRHGPKSLFLHQRKKGQLQNRVAKKAWKKFDFPLLFCYILSRYYFSLFFMKKRTRFLNLKIGKRINHRPKPRVALPKKKAARRAS
jgi:hypothetical protein